MVHKLVQKQLQAADSVGVATHDTMPTYMFKSPHGTGYIFRRAVPSDIQQIIGKREFKRALGGDFRSASARCRELAVDSDKQIEEARRVKPGKSETVNKLSNLIAEAKPRASLPIGMTPASRDSESFLNEGIHQREWALEEVKERELTLLKEVTPSILERLHAKVMDTITGIYREKRYSIDFDVDQRLVDISKMRFRAEAGFHGDEYMTLQWSPLAIRALASIGFRLDDELEGTRAERMLTMEYAGAYRDALDFVAAEYKGEVNPFRSPEMRSEISIFPSRKDVLILSKVIKHFLENLPPLKEMRAKHEVVLPSFLDVTGDINITELRQSHINNFLRLCQKLPPRWGEIRKKTKQSLVELAESSGTGLAKSTYEDTYRTSLSSFLKTAIREWQDEGFPTSLTASEPYHGSRIKREFKQRALKPAEIEAMFLSDEIKRIAASPAHVHKFWLLAIELYTGARVREICQINPQTDYGLQDKIWWLSFNDTAGDFADSDVVKSIKTAEERVIPMHPELVRLGFPGYLDKLKLAGARRIFPQWSPTEGNAGAAPAKWVTNYLKKIGLHGTLNEGGNALRGSHAFRHTLLTYGRRNHVNLRCISGHKEVSDNAVADGYEDESLLLPLTEKAARLAQLDYGVSLPMPVSAINRLSRNATDVGGGSRGRAEAAASVRTTGRARQRSGA